VFHVAALVLYSMRTLSEEAMKVLLTDRIRVLQKDPNGSKQLREFIANAKIDEAREISVSDQKGRERKFKVRLIPQG
jgi:hypothetical protein